MNLPKGSDAKKSMDIIRQKNLTEKYERHNPNVKRSNPMTNLLSFDEVDAFIYELDGGCVHRWERDGESSCWYCKKCHKEEGTLSLVLNWTPPTIDNPIARDLGKLFDFAVEKSIECDVFRFIPLYDNEKGNGIRVKGIDVWYKDYDTPKLAACAALGNGIVQVLS